MTKEKTQEAQFEKRTWAKGDRPGASDFNRIEGGIESAHERVDQLAQVVADNTTAQIQAITVADGSASEAIDAVKVKYREIEYLPDNAKVADVAATVNKLLAVLRNDENQNDGAN